MKRTFFLTMIMGLVALLWSACHTSPSIISATGMPYEVEVVTTRALWDDTVGVSLRAVGADILSSSLIIAAATFLVCFAALRIGRRFGIVLGDRAQMAGGLVLVAIGVKALLS